VSKAVLSLAAYIAAQRGLLDFDAPVARYWPEFSFNGKEAITVRDVLSHRAALLAVDDALTEDDVIEWFPVIRALEKQAPLWQPGTKFGYHALTFGWLVGEILRRTTGCMPGELVRDYFAEPLDLDLWSGIPGGLEPRLARLEQGPPFDPSVLPDVSHLVVEPMGSPVVLRSMTLGGAFPPELVSDRGFNDPRMLKAQIPGAGMVASADSLARLFGSVATGDLLNPESIADALTVRSEGDCWGGVGSPYARFSSGFMLNGIPDRPLLSDSSFGHDGALGSLAFADTKHDIGFAFICNRSSGTLDKRAGVLVQALRESLDE
jgi:CubicO group peptidase (beta-lactamase class C family)